MTERAEDLQLAALFAFTVLCSLRDEWGGALVVACGLGPGGAALSIAANIAGAASLAIDERAEVCRAALRLGACDFVVNSVDEALRVLKNELRQRRPVSVALTLAESAALGELVERGVLPELFASFGADTGDAGRAAKAFAASGSLIVHFEDSFSALADAIDGSARLEAFALDRRLHLESFSFASAEELRVFDARLLDVIPAPDARRRWCVAAPRFFHRERPFRRVVYLTANELAQLKSGL
ncbi:MAG TPA: hypothetical protein VF865_16495 [Acidobacteriaceae bacterium]